MPFVVEDGACADARTATILSWWHRCFRNAAQEDLAAMANGGYEAAGLL